MTNLHGVWESHQFEKLKEGQIFRLFDDCEDPAKDIENGTSVYVVTKDAAPCEPEGNHIVSSVTLDQEPKT